MAVADSIPSFFNPMNPPVPGGWRYWLDPETRLYPIQGSSAEDVFDQIKRYQVNNATFTTDAAIWRKLWAYWCAQEPSRCVVMPDPGTGSVSPGEIPKEVWGPILWRALNWFAANFDRQFFLSYIQEMQARLITCPACRDHFVDLMSTYPPEQIATKAQACLWAFNVHNAVSASIGKPSFAYADAVTQYGFPPL